ncbi:hypothetical protein [Campylobacter sp.]|uniref:hypothetical protein n=1 Tax=Campylobacter sp. TaxID=205 RepID=UPI0025BD56E7|nr:hypothetical protein [Campylobacter sp.]
MRAQACDFGLGTARKRGALFSAPARFAKQTKFLGAVKIKFKRFGILKFCEGEREWTEINRIALGMEFRIKFYEAAGGLNFKI